MKLDELNFTDHYLGVVDNRFKNVIMINGQSFDYFRGIGHAKKPSQNPYWKN
jgi:hypothetical protein